MNEELVATAPQKAVTVKELFNRVDVFSRFSEIMGSRNAKTYIGSVLILVDSKPELRECDPVSIYKSALRAANLELSCDESLHQAQLVPFNNRKTGKKECTMIPHYLGLVNLATRTGKYKTFNYGPIKEGQTVEVETLSGLIKIVGSPVSKDAKTIGYFAYYKMNNGFEKAEYMTIEEIHEHAKKWAKSYNYDSSAWKDEKKLPAMEQKTVIRKLLKSADMSGTTGQKLAEALEAEDDVVDGEIDLSKDVPSVIKPSAHALKDELGFQTENPDPVKDATWKAWADLVRRANAVNVPHSDVERAKTTDGDLLAYIQEITPFVRDAEDQAKA